MTKAKKMLALVLAMVMCLCLFAGCSGKTDNGTTAPTETSKPETGSTSGSTSAGTETGTTDTTGSEATTDKNNDTPLVVGYSPFNSKFSPFFADTAYDQDVAGMTQLALLTSDRTGAIIYKGIEGETIAFNGTDYTYYGPSDLTVTENADGTVYYDFVMREDLVFSDGTPVTIDDVIFSMYVLCDPTYDGNSTLYAQPIVGMEEYRSGMDTRGNVIYAAGPDGYTATELYTEAQYNAFWEYYNTNAGTDFAQEIVDYVITNYGASYGVSDVAGAAGLWGFELAEGATAEDFWNAIVEAYSGDIDNAVAVESAGSDLKTLTINALGSDYIAGVQTGDSVASISGIQKTGDYSLRVVMSKIDAVAIYQLGISIAPMHYYGDASLYDYDNNQFGFTKGDLSGVRAKTTTPMGAGPYKFLKFENGVVYFEANDSYMLGTPKTKYINFMETQEADKLNGVTTGTVDITDPPISDDVVSAITKANNGVGLTGDVVTCSLVNNLGYGYIGMNSTVMCVNNEPGSEASKNLRKAFGTILSVYRDVAIDSYYGERASVINYPISDTSWAAPRPADDGYKVAFSTDVTGASIYTSSMKDEEKYAAAQAAALGFLEAAGYTVENGKAVAAPAGASLEYEVWIPGDGVGDHPSFMILTLAKEAFANIGINFIVRDLTNSSELWTALEAQEVAMWCAAWGATVDPDMYQIYYSDVANAGTATSGQNPAGGAAQGGSNYMYCIADEELDQLIMDARASTDQTYRKAMYKACLDIVIDWAVEIPVYQRQNCIIFSTERVDMASVTPDITTFYGWLNEVQNIELN